MSIFRLPKAAALAALLSFAASPSFVTLPAFAEPITITVEDAFGDAVASSFDVQVVGVFAERGELLVKTPNKDQYPLYVPEVINDPELTVTNRVLEVSYVLGVVTDIEVFPGGEPGFSVADDVTWADQGNLPDDFIKRLVTATAQIVSVDAAAGTVTFVAPDGETRTAQVQDPKILKELKVRPGDLADITFFEAIDLEAKA
jgi:hypothetical protein